jgi:hypothetical protein
MHDLTEELTHRRDIAIEKFSWESLFAFCDYIDLLILSDEMQSILKDEHEKEHDPQSCWQAYLELYTKVYLPIKTHPEDIKKTFSHFYWLYEYDKNAPVFWIAGQWFLPPANKAFRERNRYRRDLDTVHSRITMLLRNKQLFPTNKPVRRFSFDAERSILFINQYEVRINRRGSITDQHRILASMFASGDLHQDFFYAEMAEAVYGEEYDREPRKYWEACNEINKKVAEDTNGMFPKLLLPTLERKGLVKVNPDCWALLR